MPDAKNFGLSQRGRTVYIVLLIVLRTQAHTILTDIFWTHSLSTFKIFADTDIY